MTSLTKLPVKGLSLLGMLLCWLTLSFSAQATQSVVLGWNPATNNIAGYAVHYGSSSHNYSGRLDVGTNTLANFANLQPGATNFFAVAAYDSNGNEGTLSSELAYIVPGVIRFQAPAKKGGAVTLQFPVAPGHWA